MLVLIVILVVSVWWVVCSKHPVLYSGLWYCGFFISSRIYLLYLGAGDVYLNSGEVKRCFWKGWCVTYV